MCMQFANTTLRSTRTTRSQQPVMASSVRSNAIAGMSMINRIKNTPTGCSSCGGR